MKNFQYHKEAIFYHNATYTNRYGYFHDKYENFLLYKYSKDARSSGYEKIVLLFMQLMKL